MTNPGRRTGFLCAAVCALASGAYAADGEAGEETGPARLAGQPPVRLILDCDMDSDCDDAGALGVLHALADRDEVTVLGVMVSALNPDAAACVEVINAYYGRGDLPIGTARPPAPDQASRYTRAVAKIARRPVRYPKAIDAPDAVLLYRELLAREEDGAVTIVTVGDMTNLAKLLDLPATDDLPSGRELVERKVRLWVCMGGNFFGKPARDDLKKESNNNFTLDKAATYAAITRWPGPLVFAGREVCSVPSGVKAGARLAELPAEHPVRVAYAAYFGGQPKDRHVADLASVLFAVRGLRDYWSAEGRGAMKLAPDMTFEWDPEDPRPQAYLLKLKDDRGRPNDAYIESELNALLLAPPRAATPAP